LLLQDIYSAKSPNPKKGNSSKNLGMFLCDILYSFIPPKTAKLRLWLLRSKPVNRRANEIEKQVTIKTDTVAGKILTVAKKGKLDSWMRLGDIVKAITEESWTVTSQAVNAALKDLVKQDIVAKKHTDRNYFKLAKNVSFS